MWTGNFLEVNLDPFNEKLQSHSHKTAGVSFVLLHTCTSGSGNWMQTLKV